MPRLPGESGFAGEHAATELGLVGRGGEDLRAPRLHEGAAVRLLLVRDLDHVDHDLEAEEATRERERRAPLAGAGLGGQPLDAFLGVVVRLRHRGVGLVGSRRRCSLVLVEDPCGGVERLLQTAGAIERGGAPQLVDVADAIGDLDPALRRDLLPDDRHREDGGEVRGRQRLERPRAQERTERLRDVREDVVPVRRQLVFRQQELRCHPFHLCQSL